jgi:Schlafen, AlbA_2
MARDDVFAGPIDEITFEHISDLADEKVEEGIRLEFKRTFSTSDGQPDKWMRDQSGIGRNARNDIAKEVVAFANAYGGVVIIGIDETDDHPKRARQLAFPQIPRVAECAEQLARALRGIVDPPLPMLEVRGIASGASGEGVVVIRVGPSPSGPHGFGIPPATYVRHGSESKPLSMRELQSMFFERRTRLERVESRRRELSRLAQELWRQQLTGTLLKISKNEAFAKHKPCFQFRCSLVPTDDLAIDNFPDQFLQIGRSPKPVITGTAEVVVLPEFAQEWIRRYRAVEHARNSADQRYWQVSLESDGAINQMSIVAKVDPIRGTHETDLFKIAPAWYARVVLQGIVLAEWLRRWAARPDVEYALDGEFNNNGAHVVSDPNFNETEAVSWPRESIGPYSVGSRATFQATFDVIERELWDAFGLRRPSPLKFDLAEVFRSIGL